MSDISISFPLWTGAWFLLGEAAPFTTIVAAGLVVAIVASRNSGRAGRLRWLTLALAVVGSAWLAGVSFWAAGLLDDIRSNIYEAQHHYRLDKAAAFEGIQIPSGSWVSVDEDRRLYGIGTDQQKPISIDGASWNGDIRLILPGSRNPSDRGIIKSGTLAADSIIQGIPCLAGKVVKFADSGGDLQQCTLSDRIVVTAEVPDGPGTKTTYKLTCAGETEVRLRVFGGSLLESCVLAETSAIGSVVCAAGREIVFDGDGLSACSLAAAQRVGRLVLPGGTSVGFSRGLLDRLELPASNMGSVSISGIDIPPGTAAHLCERASELEWLLVPENQYVLIGSTKLTGRMNFDCGEFKYGSLFEDAMLRDQLLPRGAGVSRKDLP